MAKQVLGPEGQVWATAPDDTWNLRDEPFPEVGVRVEACWSSRFKTPAEYGFGIVSLDYIQIDEHGRKLSSWRNERGEQLLFNPDFWRLLRGTDPTSGEPNA